MKPAGGQVKTKPRFILLLKLQAKLSSVFLGKAPSGHAYCVTEEGELCRVLDGSFEGIHSSYG